MDTTEIVGKQPSNAEAYLSLRPEFIYTFEVQPGIHEKYVVAEGGGCKIAIKDICFINEAFDRHVVTNDKIRFITTDATRYRFVPDFKYRNVDPFMILDCHDILRQKWMGSSFSRITETSMLQVGMEIMRVTDSKTCLVVAIHIGKIVLYELE